NAFAAHDDRGDFLVVRTGRDWEYRRVRHRRMRADDLLDLERRDVLAAPADAVLLAVDEPEIAVGIETSAVAGVEPLVAVCRESLFRHLVVAHRRAPRIVAAQHDLAGLAGWDLEIVVVDDFHLHAAPRPADRSQLPALVALG